MNIMFKNTRNIENNRLNSLPKLHGMHSSSFNNSHGESPLELKSSQDLSFKGLSSIKVNDAVKMFAEDFGKSAGEYFGEIIKKESMLKKSGFNINPDGTATFVEKTLPKKVLEILSYPVTQMPYDLANAVLGGLRKIPGCKNLGSSFDKGLLKEKREISSSKSNVAAIKHYFELITKGDKVNRFKMGHKRLAPLITTYNAETERSLNRLVTGLIPAFFLANDAYNLSIYMNNNKDVAKKEKKRRFNQEVGRILTTTAVTYGVMSLFAKQCNKSIGLTAAVTSGIVLISEIIGRKLAGNPVLPVSTDNAKEYAQKRNSAKQTEQNKDSKYVETQSKEPAKKGGLTLNNILKTIGGLIVFGFTAEKISNTKAVSTKIKSFKKWYENLYTKDFVISKEKFLKSTKRLKDNGFDSIANKYEKAIINNDDDINNIKLGKITNKFNYILIHQILAFPVRFTWSVLNLPYQKVITPIIKMIRKSAKTVDVNKHTSTVQSIQESIRFLEKVEDASPDEFKKQVNKRLISSFDNLTKSSYNNSDLNVVVKTAQSAVTTGFLIADNYNMVMIDSQGKDKDLAGQKAKERAMQRGARLTYEAFIIKMLMDMFAGPCNSSLLAALGLAGGLRVVTEMVERKAVGLPISESTQEQVKEDEKIHLSATGVKGSYFRAMAKLSGKKNFTEKRGNEKNR
jgi:hypothetical protein